jgi:hypothetical protein
MYCNLLEKERAKLLNLQEKGLIVAGCRYIGRLKEKGKPVLYVKRMVAPQLFHVSMCLASTWAVALVAMHPKTWKWPLCGYLFPIMRNCVGVGFDFRKCI